MAQYILNDILTLIAEKSGTIVNNSNVPVEITTDTAKRTGITLFPRQHFPFSKAVYAARAPGAIGTAFIGVIPTKCCDGASSSGSGEISTQTIVVNCTCHCDCKHEDDEGGFTDDDVKDIFDDSDSDSDSDGFSDKDVEDVFDDSDGGSDYGDDFYDDDHFDPEDNDFTRADVDFVFDDSDFELIGFTDDDVDFVFND